MVYLHEDSEPIVIHQHLKSSSILLDRQWNPKISDIGITKLIGHERSQSIIARPGSGMTGLVCHPSNFVTLKMFYKFANLVSFPRFETLYSTLCRYIAPEYVLTHNFDKKSDVYSFGVLIMEIISGRTPVEYSESGETVSFFLFVIIISYSFKMFMTYDIS